MVLLDRICVQHATNSPPGCQGAANNAANGGSARRSILAAGGTLPRQMQRGFQNLVAFVYGIPHTSRHAMTCIISVITMIPFPHALAQTSSHQKAILKIHNCNAYQTPYLLHVCRLPALRSVRAESVSASIGCANGAAPQGNCSR